LSTKGMISKDFILFCSVNTHKTLNYCLFK